MNKESMREAYHKYCADRWKEFVDTGEPRSIPDISSEETFNYAWQAAYKLAQEQQIKRDAALCADKLPDRSNDPNNPYLKGIDDGIENCQSAIKNQERNANE